MFDEFGNAEMENQADEFEAQQDFLRELAEQEENEELSFCLAWRDGFDNIHEQMEM